MPKQTYIPLICGPCELEFGIRKKDYNPKHAYNCPMCLSLNIVTPEDLERRKLQVGRPRKNRMPILIDERL